MSNIDDDRMGQIEILDNSVSHLVMLVEVLFLNLNLAVAVTEPQEQHVVGCTALDLSLLPTKRKSRNSSQNSNPKSRRSSTTSSVSSSGRWSNVVDPITFKRRLAACASSDFISANQRALQEHQSMSESQAASRLILNLLPSFVPSNLRPTELTSGTLGQGMGAISAEQALAAKTLRAAKIDYEYIARSEYLQKAGLSVGGDREIKKLDEEMQRVKRAHLEGFQVPEGRRNFQAVLKARVMRRKGQGLENEGLGDVKEEDIESAELEAKGKLLLAGAMEGGLSLGGSKGVKAMKRAVIRSRMLDRIAQQEARERAQKAITGLIRILETVRGQVRSFRLRNELLSNLVKWLMDTAPPDHCRGDATSDWWAEFGVPEHIEAPGKRQPSTPLERLRMMMKVNHLGKLRARDPQPWNKSKPLERPKTTGDKKSFSSAAQREKTLEPMSSLAKTMTRFPTLGRGTGAVQDVVETVRLRERARVESMGLDATQIGIPVVQLKTLRKFRPNTWDAEQCDAIGFLWGTHGCRNPTTPETLYARVVARDRWFENRRKKIDEKKESILDERRKERLADLGDEDILEGRSVAALAQTDVNSDGLNSDQDLYEMAPKSRLFNSLAVTRSRNILKTPKSALPYGRAEPEKTLFCRDTVLMRANASSTFSGTLLSGTEPGTLGTTSGHSEVVSEESLMKKWRARSGEPRNLYRSDCLDEAESLEDGLHYTENFGVLKEGECFQEYPIITPDRVRLYRPSTVTLVDPNTGANFEDLDELARAGLAAKVAVKEEEANALAFEGPDFLLKEALPRFVSPAEEGLELATLTCDNRMQGLELDLNSEDPQLERALHDSAVRPLAVLFLS